MSSPLVWLITGTTSGFGWELTLEALARGDKVIATGRARSFAKLEALKQKGADILELDVTSPLDTLHEIAKKAIGIHGRIDVLVNNAGNIIVGSLEECTPEETYNQFNTNVFSGLNVARAFLPYMREKRTGTVVWIGSVFGWQHAPGYAGLYSATKWALRTISMTLHEEISPLGLRSTCLDYGFFRTPILNFEQRGPVVSRIPDYQEIDSKVEAMLQGKIGKQPGDPVAGVKLIADVVRGEGAAAGKPFPLNLVVGSDCFNVARSVTQDTLKQLDEWQAVSTSTDYKQ